MSLADLIYEPNEYAQAVEWYRMSRMDPMVHLNDELASQLLAIAEFGLREFRSALDLADEMERDWRENAIIEGVIEGGP